jgi:hypothetical protein
VAGLAEERRALADQLSRIDPETWDAPSRHIGWAVRDIVAQVCLIATGRAALPA